MSWCWTALRSIACGSLFLITGCNAEGPDSKDFQIISVQADLNSRPMIVSLELKLKFSNAVEQALNKGVTIPLKATAHIIKLGLINRDIEDHGHRWEIRYLPMSEHYILRDMRSGEESSYARLRHALAQLNHIDVELRPGELQAGEYRIEARIILDRRRLPAPMRLPALVSSAWQLKSDWYQWPFHI